MSRKRTKIKYHLPEFTLTKKGQFTIDAFPGKFVEIVKDTFEDSEGEHDPDVPYWYNISIPVYMAGKKQDEIFITLNLN